jgi:hypothetical protein
MLGKPLMPWQQYVADVALEVDPDTGRLAYREMRLTVPRQSGKTLLILALAVLRCRATDFFGPRQAVVYTAQTRKDAKKKFKEDYEPDLLSAPRLLAKPSWAPGDEHVRFPNRSRFGIESTTEKAGHGSTLDVAFIDEAFAQVDNRLEQAFGPAMITRRNTQKWIISTAGWEDASPFLKQKVEHGRELLAAGEPSRIAYFEWSAPQEADPFDPVVWRGCMPALGLTIEEDAIAAELALAEASEEGVNGFRRAYLNQWVPKFAAGGAIPSDMWRRAADASSKIVGRPTLALSMTPDQATVSLAAAGRRADGTWHVEIVQHGHPNVVTAAGAAEIARRNGAELALHPGHAAGAMLPDLERANLRLRKLASGDYTRGCGAFFDAVRTGQLFYPAPQPELDAAVARATRKFTGEAWRWAGSDISALVAATQALIAAMTAPAAGKGRVVLLAQ